MTENNKQVKSYIIKKEEIYKLLWVMDDNITTHELSMWLKSKTNDEWVVVPRFFCRAMMEFVENEFKEFGITEKFGLNLYLEQIKKYL